MVDVIYPSSLVYFLLGISITLLSGCAGKSGKSADDVPTPRQGVVLEDGANKPWVGSPQLNSDGTRGIFLGRKNNRIDVFGFETAIGGQEFAASALSGIEPLATSKISDAFFSPNGGFLSVVVAQSESDSIYQLGWLATSTTAVGGFSQGRVKRIQLSSDGNLAVVSWYDSLKHQIFVYLPQNAVPTGYLISGAADERLLGVQTTTDSVKIYSVVASAQDHSLQYLVRSLSSAQIADNAALETAAGELSQADISTFLWLENGYSNQSFLPQVQTELARDYVIGSIQAENTTRALAGNSPLIGVSKETVQIKSHATALLTDSLNSKSAGTSAGFEWNFLSASTANNMAIFSASEVKRCRIDGVDQARLYGHQLGVWDIDENSISLLYLGKSLTAASFAPVVLSDICQKGLITKIKGIAVNTQASTQDFRGFITLSEESGSYPVIWSRQGGVDSVYNVAY